MQGTRVAAPRTDSSSAEDVNIDPGLNSLLRGAKPEERAPTEAAELSANPISGHTHQARLIQCSLICADVLLSGLAALIVFKRTAPLGVGEMIFCFAAIGLGAWLSCLAVLLDPPPE